MKKRIDKENLRKALVATFKHYSWNVTDYDVWAGIHTYFADNLWLQLDGRKLKSDKIKHLCREPKECLHKMQYDKKESDIEKSYKKLFWKFYKKTN